MANHLDEPTTRVHIHLYTRDKERIEAIWGNSLGFSKAVRLIIRKMLDQTEAKAAEKAKPIGELIKEAE